MKKITINLAEVELDKVKMIIAASLYDKIIQLEILQNTFAELIVTDELQRYLAKKVLK